MNARRAACIVTLAAIGACRGGSEGVPDSSLLSEYNALANPGTERKASAEIDCYIDYSFGMGEGMKTTSAINDRLKNFLGGRTVTYYKVGSADVPPVLDIGSPQANFLDLSNFKEPLSKLKVAIDRISQTPEKTSIFITDFERVDNVALKQNLPGAPAPHPIDASAWAQRNFKDWLSSGNQIDIFARQYTKPDFWFDKAHKAAYPNWIYTILFTPAGTLSDDNLYRASPLKFLVDEYKVAGADARHFSFGTRIKLEQAGTDPALGNANDNIVVQQVDTGHKQEGFEFYEFSSSDLTKFNTDDSQTDKRLINKIKLIPETSNFDLTFGMRVYDITDSFAKFADARTQQAPEVKTNVETGAKDTVANKPVRFSYSKSPEAGDVFDFVYNAESKEVGIKLKPDFAGVSEDKLYQIDLIAKDAQVRTQADADDVLRLNYAKGYTIKSLGESLRLALSDVGADMGTRTLYTVYIRITK